MAFLIGDDKKYKPMDGWVDEQTGAECTGFAAL